MGGTLDIGSIVSYLKVTIKEEYIGDIINILFMLEGKRADKENNKNIQDKKFKEEYATQDNKNDKML